MDTKIIIVLVIACAIIAALRHLSSGNTRKQHRTPTTTHFKCARCNTREKYSRRTRDAYGKGVEFLFCRTCHGKWVEGKEEENSRNY